MSKLKIGDILKFTDSTGFFEVLTPTNSYGKFQVRYIQPDGTYGMSISLNDGCGDYSVVTNRPFTFVPTSAKALHPCTTCGSEMRLLFTDYSCDRCADTKQGAASAAMASTELLDDDGPLESLYEFDPANMELTEQDWQEIEKQADEEDVENYPSLDVSDIDSFTGINPSLMGPGNGSTATEVTYYNSISGAESIRHTEFTGSFPLTAGKIWGTIPDDVDEDDFTDKEMESLLQEGWNRGVSALRNRILGIFANSGPTWATKSLIEFVSTINAIKDVND